MGHFAGKRGRRHDRISTSWWAACVLLSTALTSACRAITSASGALAAPAIGFAPARDPGSTSGADDPVPDAEQDASSAPGSSTRRALPPPFPSPPFPRAEYAGDPLVGVPPGGDVYPFTGWLYDLPFGDALERDRIEIDGWVNAAVVKSNAEDSNLPTSPWIVPDSLQLEQAVLRLDRAVDSAQTEHVDVGSRSTFLYGTDYRLTTSGGWFSDQLLEENEQYGIDPVEQYLDVYVPGVKEGLILRFGRFLATSSVETPFAPDNYLATHSLSYTFGAHTLTGSMATVMLDEQWSVQAGLHAGTDMAPWYDGAVLTGMAGVRWVSLDSDDSVQFALNAINEGEFQRFDVNGQPAGHDNFNYLVGAWQHRFSPEVHTLTESYFMWQKDAVVGGTPNVGPMRDFGGGGGIGADIPGTALTYGLVNYTMFQHSERQFLTVRNEVWTDEDGARSGFPGTYTSHTLGITHDVSRLVRIRPEVGYFLNWNEQAFDLGTSRDLLIAGFDVTIRF